MATWVELEDSPARLLTRQVMLCVGEISSLVWDKVQSILHSMDYYVHVEDPHQMVIGSSLTSSSSAYLVVNPNSEMLRAVENFLRSSPVESVILLSGDEVETEGKDAFNYIKKKAQQSKKYFSISAPKSETAREKMITHYRMKWGVSTEASHKVCSVLEFSPGKLYLFSQQFLMTTGGRVLPSSRTNSIIEELIGEDSPSMVVMWILNHKPVNTEFSVEYTNKVLGFLLMLVNDSIAVNSVMNQGVSQTTQISRDAGVPVFRVLRAMGMATKHSYKTLSKYQQRVIWGFQHRDQPNLLSVLSRVWGT